MIPFRFLWREFSNRQSCRSPVTMARYLTRHRLEQLQSELFADDVALDVERMRHWSEADAKAFFASGGAEPPLAPSTAMQPSARMPLNADCDADCDGDSCEMDSARSSADAAAQREDLINSALEPPSSPVGGVSLSDWLDTIDEVHLSQHELHDEL